MVSGVNPNRDDRPGIRYDDGSGHRQKGGAGLFNGADTDNPGPPRALAWIEDTDPHLAIYCDFPSNSKGCAAARKQRSKLDQSRCFGCAPAPSPPPPTCFLTGGDPIPADDLPEERPGERRAAAAASGDGGTDGGVDDDDELTDARGPLEMARAAILQDSG